VHAGVSLRMVERRKLEGTRQAQEAPSAGQDAALDREDLTIDDERYAHPRFDTSEDPVRDAWYTAFFIENHMDHFAYPEQVATPEQVRFMVFTEENERYYPCSDTMFSAIMNRTRPPFVAEKYDAALTRILTLIEETIEDTWEKKYLKSLIETKWNHETRDGIMIPSRVEKRLLNIFLKRTQIEDPYVHEKSRRNVRTMGALHSPSLLEALNRIDPTQLAPYPSTLEGLKARIDRLKIKRLFALSTQTALWEADTIAEYSTDDYLKIFSRPFTGDGLDHMERLLVPEGEGAMPLCAPSLKILWLADEAGEVMIDMVIVHYLARLGHKLIVAFKDGPLFTKVHLQDVLEDASLRAYLEGAYLIKENTMGKNELVNTLKKDKHIMVVSDGTRENLNLLLVSTTFARIFKEVDLVISRGQDQRRRLFQSHFRFTQDVLSVARNEGGQVSLLFKPRHPHVIKFSHSDLEKKAGKITCQMQEAKKGGMTVVFYSGIIGSIPGRIQMAKKIMSVFIDHLREQSADTFIINPSEYYEPGMDADDLMFMWEIVQRSGLIDIWRFQAYEDILTAFTLMRKKVPPEWVGKDATFSTGCTKEMKIALEVSRAFPEMQIIGPPREKFTRREEYGVGKMYDRRLD